MPTCFRCQRSSKSETAAAVRPSASFIRATSFRSSSGNSNVADVSVSPSANSAFRSSKRRPSAARVCIFTVAGSSADNRLTLATSRVSSDSGGYNSIGNDAAELVSTSSDPRRCKRAENSATSPSPSPSLSQ